MLRKVSVGALALLGAIGLIGCGGDGGSQQGSGSQTFLFLTDALNTNYDHVWATVTKVNLVTSGGKTTNIYDGSSSGGQTVDLVSLNAAAGHPYLLLAAFQPPQGSFVAANVTVSSSLSIVPTGQATAVKATFSGAAGALTVLSVKFAAPRTVNSSPDWIIDFNLANWNLSGTTVSASNGPYGTCGPPNGPFNPGNFAGGMYFGTVGNLTGTAPNLSFAIAQGPNTVTVNTSSATVLYNANGSPNPTLTNGEFVVVAGAFDATSGAIDASAIIIGVGPTSVPPMQVIGQVTSDSLSSNTITVQVNGCGGFQPPTTLMTIDVTSNTTFVDSSGATDTEAQFFEDLTAGTTVIRAQGVISGSTLTASSVQIVPPAVNPGGPITVDMQGPVSNINATADSFSMTSAQWTGGWQSPTAVISVVTTSQTQYLVNGASESASTFFGNLTPGNLVNVRGTVDPPSSTLTAGVITLIPSVNPLKR